LVLSPLIPLYIALAIPMDDASFNVPVIPAGYRVRVGFVE